MGKSRVSLHPANARRSSNAAGQGGQGSVYGVSVYGANIHNSSHNDENEQSVSSDDSNNSAPVFFKFQPSFGEIPPFSKTTVKIIFNPMVQQKARGIRPRLRFRPSHSALPARGWCGWCALKSYNVTTHGVHRACLNETKTQSSLTKVDTMLHAVLASFAFIGQRTIVRAAVLGARRSLRPLSSVPCVPRPRRLMYFPTSSSRRPRRAAWDSGLPPGHLFRRYSRPHAERPASHGTGARLSTHSPTSLTCRDSGDVVPRLPALKPPYLAAPSSPPPPAHHTQITNSSTDLPVTVNIGRGASFKTEPAVITIPAGEGLPVKVIYQPNNMGNHSDMLKIRLFDRERELKYAEEVPKIRVEGSALAAALRSTSSRASEASAAVGNEAEQTAGGKGELAATQGRRGGGGTKKPSSAPVSFRRPTLEKPEARTPSPHPLLVRCS